MALTMSVSAWFCRVSDALLVGSPDESNNGRVIGGEPCVAYGQCEKRDQAAAISIGHHAAVRAVVLAYALSLRNLEEMMHVPRRLVRVPVSVLYRRSSAVGAVKSADSRLPRLTGGLLASSIYPLGI